MDCEDVDVGEDFDIWAGADFDDDPEIDVCEVLQNMDGVDMVDGSEVDADEIGRYAEVWELVEQVTRLKSELESCQAEKILVESERNELLKKLQSSTEYTNKLQNENIEIKKTIKLSPGVSGRSNTFQNLAFEINANWYEITSAIALAFGGKGGIGKAISNPKDIADLAELPEKAKTFTSFLTNAIKKSHKEYRATLLERLPTSDQGFIKRALFVRGRTGVWKGLRFGTDTSDAVPYPKLTGKLIAANGDRSATPITPINHLSSPSSVIAKRGPAPENGSETPPKKMRPHAPIIVSHSVSRSISARKVPPQSSPESLRSGQLTLI